MSQNAEAPFPGLGWRYGQQFSDPAVVEAYKNRRPYPSVIAEFISELASEHAPESANKGPSRILEIGCGTGDLTKLLASSFKNVTALDPSGPALRIARERVPNWVEFVCARFEDWDGGGEFDICVAGESFHWLDWAAAFEKLKPILSGNALLILVNRIESFPADLEAGLSKIIPHYSTNKDYTPYDLASELQKRGFVRFSREKTTATELHQQTPEAFIECIHSRNGFSRDRMSVQAAEAFDDEVKGLLAEIGIPNNVPIEVSAQVQCFELL